MRNVVVGSFLGVVLAAAFLAACGGASGPVSGGGQVPATTGEERWSAPQTTHPIATGINLNRNVTWLGTSIYDNGAASSRNRYAAFEITANIDHFQPGPATVEIGILAAPDGVNFANQPQWIGSAEIQVGDNRRAVLSGVQIPPTRLKFAMRLQGSNEARITAYRLTPYNRVTQ